MRSLIRLIRILFIAVVLLYAYHHFTSRYSTPVLTLKVSSLLPGPTVFRLYNKTDHPIWLDSADHARGMQAGYASAIAPYHYSVFYLSKGGLAFVCYQGALGVTTKKVSCGDVLNVHSGPPAANDVNLGNYWLTENQPLS